MEVIPFGIVTLNLSDFPHSRPLFHRLLSLYGSLYIVVGLNINEQMNAVFLCESGASILSVLPDTAGKIVRHADLKRTVLAAGEDVDVIAHMCGVVDWIPGTSPGMTRFGFLTPPCRG